MARKVNLISVRLNLNRSLDSNWFSDYYYRNFLYQDLNFRDYFGSICPPTETRLAFVLIGLLFTIFLKGHLSCIFFGST